MNAPARTNRTSAALRLSASLAGGLLLSAAAQCWAAADDGAGLRADTLIDGRPISRNQVRVLGASLEKDQGLTAQDAEVAARNELVTQEVLAQAARRDGLDKAPQLADQLAYQERAILARLYLERYFAQHPISEADLEKQYERNRTNGKIVEYKLRQILLGSQAEADKVRAQLATGGNFTEVARAQTQDPAGRLNGGDLGWFRPDTFVDHHFADAVVALKKGEISAPFSSRFGWHVVLLEEGPRAVAHPQPYRALGDTLQQALRQRAAQRELERLTTQLTAKTKVVRASTVAANTPATNGSAAAAGAKP